ncbi:flagellar motor protein MotA [Limibacillus halophilus]
MTQPTRYLVRMLIFLGLVGAGAALLYPRLADAFAANAVLNGMILVVLALGILFIIKSVVSLYYETRFAERLKQESGGINLVMPGELSEQSAPRLLAPLATMIRERKGRLTLSTLSLRSILDGISSRIEETHEISRYLIGLLVFLGLLGTFWGLLETVSAVGDTIQDLSVEGGDAGAMFSELKAGLETPLSGMGTAFSSSLFGLAGSLVLGFMELQAAQAHNRFVNELEEWLSGSTKISSGGAISEGEGSVPAYIQALLEQTADSLDNLQRIMARGEEKRASIDQDLAALAERLSLLTDQMRGEQQVLRRLVETQEELRPVLQRLAEARGGGAAGLDDASREHIRSMDYRLERIGAEIGKGRSEIVQEMRNEIRLLARTIAALAEEENR